MSNGPEALSEMVITEERTVKCMVCGEKWATIMESLTHPHFASPEPEDEE